MNRTECLEKANQLITKDRHEEHGDAQENIGRIAEFWTSYTGMKITSQDVCAMMILVKMSRAGCNHTDDNFVDAAGYCGLGCELIEIKGARRA